MEPLGDISTLKRLLFEAQTMLLAQLREQVSNPDAGTQRKLPAVERETRFRNLRTRLAGVVIEKSLEPSHSLLDLVSQQWESKQLTYISPERCTSREWEISMGKTSKQLSMDVDKLLVKNESAVPDQQVTTEMQTFEALRRRGIALAFADSLSWECHERYIQKLFNHLRTEAPEGYSKTTLQQLLKADRQVFMHMIQSDVSVRRQPDNSLEMDTALFRALEAYEVAFHLVPLPKLKSSEGKASPSNQSNQPQRYSAWSPRQSQGSSPYKGKSGKGKGKTKRSQSMLPKEFHGRDNVSVDSHGRRFCFDYNLGKCQKAAHGAQCDRGWHLCMRKGCHAPHPEGEHGKQGHKPN